MNWRFIESPRHLETLIGESETTPCLIFKHSTRCGISALAKSRLEAGWKFSGNTLSPYFLDLLAFREISGAIEERFLVRHESPQILLIKNGECVYHASHVSIEVAKIEQFLSGD